MKTIASLKYISEEEGKEGRRREVKSKSMDTKDSVIVTLSDSHHLDETDGFHYTHTSVYVLNTCIYMYVYICMYITVYIYAYIGFILDAFQEWSKGLDLSFCLSLN